VKIRPTEAFCAVGPTGKIDIDMIRMGRAGAEHAAGVVSGLGWAAMRAQGYEVVPIVIVPRRDAGDAPMDLPDAPAHPPSFSHGRVEAAPRKRAVRIGTSGPLVRFGRTERV
jgi:hypothetical protein